MKEELKYVLELKIDDAVYTFSSPGGAPITAGVDAAMHFYMVMKKKLDEYHAKLEEEGKAVEIKTDDDLVKEEEVKEEE